MCSISLQNVGFYVQIIRMTTSIYRSYSHSNKQREIQIGEIDGRTLQLKFSLLKIRGLYHYCSIVYSSVCLTAVAIRARRKHRVGALLAAITTGAPDDDIHMTAAFPFQ